MCSYDGYDNEILRLSEELWDSEREIEDLRHELEVVNDENASLNYYCDKYCDALKECLHLLTNGTLETLYDDINKAKSLIEKVLNE